MAITLKPIKIYQEQEPYDVDVDNRPLLDIRDNLSSIAGILEAAGNYAEIAADPSSEPANGFSPFTCACVYSNSLLIPINIATPVSSLDYSAFPIVLVLNYMADIKKYACMYFSAGIKLSDKFASFTPGAEGRLLCVGPGGELVDQMYYDLAHASKGYQSLYVGKILTSNSISFGGNQVSILGSNFYLGKNRNDTTSGIVTVQRSNSDSNVIFRGININDTGTAYNFAEYVNSSSSASSLSNSPIPVYFASSQLSYNQATATFTSPNLETYLNEVHFNTPSINSLSGSTQTYLTSGVNVRGLLDFNATNVVHSSTYSNTSGELSQVLSTKLIFTNRTPTVLNPSDIPMGLSIPYKVKSIGTSIFNNQPNNINPVEDTTGITFGDYFGTGGAYFGAVQDDSAAAVGRPDSVTDQATQTVAGAITSNIITDYSDSFTLVLSARSGVTAANIAINTDGYLSLASGKGILTNSLTPKLDSELTSKRYLDSQIAKVAASDANKVPITGTIENASISDALVFDLTDPIKSPSNDTNVLTFKGVNWVEIASYQKVKFLDAPGSTTLQYVYANTSSGTIPVDGERFQLVNKEFLAAYVATSLTTTTPFVTAGDVGALASPQSIYGLKTLKSTLSSIVDDGDDCLSLASLGSGTGGVPVTFAVSGSGVNVGRLTIGSTQPVVLSRSTADADPDGALVTKDYVVGKVDAVGPGYDAKCKHEFAPPTASLANVANRGYSILGDLAHYWCETVNFAFPAGSSPAHGGDQWNPEYTIGIPSYLFSKLFTVQVVLNNLDGGGGNNDDDVFMQVIGFDPSNVTSVTIKFQSARNSGSNGFSALLYIVGKVGDVSHL